MHRYVPRGFDAFLGNGGGSYVSPKFVAAGLADAGMPDGVWHAPAGSYSTAVIGNATVACGATNAAPPTDPRAFSAHPQTPVRLQCPVRRPHH